MASVTLQGIRKSYGTTKVIRGVDLNIKDGEFLVLVGPSGCGKSTLLRTIAGLEDISSGTLTIGDRIVNDVPPRDRGIGMVFQSYALYPHMTVRENMAFGLKIRKIPPKTIDERVRKVSAQLELTKYLDRHPKQLSGGQRQRVAMGRAIVRKPDVFLFDEPLSNLDAALRTQMRVELKKLHQQLEATMIYVTHDQIEAMTLADRIAIVSEGLIQQVGPPNHIYAKPHNMFVAGFIGSPSMNFLEVKNTQKNMCVGKSCSFHDPKSLNPHTVGVRPQHMTITQGVLQEVPKGFGRIEAVVDVIEPMGWEAYVHMHCSGQPLVAHVQTKQIEGLSSGHKVTCMVAPENVHFFDAQGIRINP